MTRKPGTIYLIHFGRPLFHAKHYLGWTGNLTSRIKRHFEGHGSRLMAAVLAAGIEITVVRTWAGDRNLERKLKKRKNSPKLCPICSRKKTDSLVVLHPPTVTDLGGL